MSEPFTWNDAARRILADQFALLVHKQADYGPSNINAFGELGVVVRLSDKLERLKHLLFTQDTEGRMVPREATPQNESVDDTYRDILNYALIALMLRQHTWDLPFDAHGQSVEPPVDGVFRM